MGNEDSVKTHPNTTDINIKMNKKDHSRGMKGEREKEGEGKEMGKEGEEEETR